MTESRTVFTLTEQLINAFCWQAGIALDFPIGTLMSIEPVSEKVERRNPFEKSDWRDMCSVPKDTPVMVLYQYSGNAHVTSAVLRDGKWVTTLSLVHEPPLGENLNPIGWKPFEVM